MQTVLEQRLTRSTDAERHLTSFMDYTSKRQINSWEVDMNKDHERNKLRNDYVHFTGKHEVMSILPCVLSELVIIISCTIGHGDACVCSAYFWVGQRCCWKTKAKEERWKFIILRTLNELTCSLPDMQSSFVFMCIIAAIAISFIGYDLETSNIVLLLTDLELE